ncbi:MAG: O-antigen ligase family protein [Lachnospiraceae bacterium]|nr:O-antigen ligase family protein [Lachnospiraceae bacterium]
MSRKIKREKTSEYRASNALLRSIRWVTDVYLILLICIYPFVIKPGYASTSFMKYKFLTGISYYLDLGFIVVPTFIPIVITLATFGMIKYLKETKKSIFVFIKEIRLSAPDIAVLIYMISLLLSSLVASNKKELLWGYPTWNMGLASQVLFICLYFIISRFFNLYELELMTYATLVSSAGVFIIEILQKLGINAFGLYDGKKMVNRMVSTIGNINWFSSYNTFFIALSAFIVCYFDKSTKIYKAGIFHLIISSASLVTQNSDSAFAGLFMLMSVLLVCTSDSMDRMMAFIETILVVLLTFRSVGFVRYLRGDNASIMADLSIIMTQGIIMWVPITILIVVYIYLFFRRKRGNAFNPHISGFMPKVIILMLVLILTGCVTYIIINTNGLLPEKYSSDSRYLYYDMYWGSKRGALWRDTVMSLKEEFKAEPLKVIFGAGADQYYSVVEKYVSEQIKAVIKSVATNAHNEWLTAFVNYGIIGGIAYSGIFISSLVRYAKHRRILPYVIAVAGCIAAYMAHNMFSFQQFVCTPYAFVALGIGEQIIRTGYKGLEEGL